MDTVSVKYTGPDPVTVVCATPPREYDFLPGASHDVSVAFAAALSHRHDFEVPKAKGSKGKATPSKDQSEGEQT